MSENDCKSDRTHSYQLVGNPYSKGDDDVSYQVIFCVRCGGTKEIIVKDERENKDKG